jgi:multiple sugar transport system substrate-binding protein
MATREFTRRSLLRNATIAAAGLAVPGALAACSKSDSGSSGSNVRLRMTIWSSAPAHVNLFKSLADEFMKTHSNVTNISIESFNLAELDTLFTTQIAAGDAPDVSWLPVESSLEYMKAGALVDLAPTLKSTPDYNFDDLVPALRTRWVDVDKMFGVPFSTGPLVMYYNKDLYAKAKVKDPGQLRAENNWTWESFRKASKQLHDALGIPGYVLNDFDFKNWTRLLPFMFAYGASPWNDAATTCTVDSPEMVAAMSVFHGMVFKDGSSPLPGQQADFWGGQAAATSAFLGAGTKLADAKFKWGLVPTPAGTENGTVAVGQAAITALAAGKHPKEAAEFVAFLTTKQSMQKYAGSFPPIRESLLTPEILSAGSAILTPDLVRPITDGVKSGGKVFPVAASNAAVANALNSSLDEFLYKPDADVAQALGKARDAIGPLLK